MRILAGLLLVSTTILGQPRSDVADREASVAAVLLPIAGEVPGAFGTQFQTDVTIANRTQAEVRVGVFWLPQNRSGSMTVPVQTLTFAPNTTRFFPRFVSDTLGETGLGAVVVRALNDDGSTNSSAHLDAYARIWTPARIGGGTYSQGIYGSTLAGPGTDDLQPISAWIYGLRQDASFRSNYGIVNLADGARTFDIVAVGENGARYERTVTLPACSMLHESLPQGKLFGQVTYEMVVHYVVPFNLSLAWTGFGSSVDNVTGDAWYSKAQAAYRNNQP
jgi:hypothetical protein